MLVIEYLKRYISQISAWRSLVLVGKSDLEQIPIMPDDKPCTRGINTLP